MRKLPACFIVFLLLWIAFAFPRCAQIVAPTGGPRDSIPPFLVSAVPRDSSLHFNSKKIELFFNKFIQLQDLQKQLIIAPTPKRQPQFRSKLRSLTVTWFDTLKPNTTYIINMGNAIEDITEGNQLKNFRYVFSTGNYLDSLEISGKMITAPTGLPDSTAAVMLYNSTEDSVVTKEKPVYYTKANGDGSFLFQNLPHGTFKIFALDETNGDLEYDDTTEAIAFISKPLKVDSNIRGITLLSFLEKENVPKSSESAPAVPAKGKEKNKKLNFSAQLNGSQQDLNKPLVINFETPLKETDSAKIILQEDTTYRPVSFAFSADTAHKSIRLSYKWKEDMPYRLILDSGFVSDTSGLTLAKPDTVNFRSKSLSDYGTLTLHFETADTTNLYVVQLFLNDQMIHSSPVTGNMWKQGYLDPGTYQVRILKDDNHNGKWDRGCYYCKRKRQPEQVYSIPDKFTVKANWDNDYSNLKFTFPVIEE
jgi:uncharacterized protein (DUF2141 family)